MMILRSFMKKTVLRTFIYNESPREERKEKTKKVVKVLSTNSDMMSSTQHQLRETHIKDYYAQNGQKKKKKKKPMSPIDVALKNTTFNIWVKKLMGENISC